MLPDSSLSSTWLFYIKEMGSWHIVKHQAKVPPLFPEYSGLPCNMMNGWAHFTDLECRFVKVHISCNHWSKEPAHLLPQHAKIVTLYKLFTEWRSGQCPFPTTRKLLLEKKIAAGAMSQIMRKKSNYALSWEKCERIPVQSYKNSTHWREMRTVTRQVSLGEGIATIFHGREGSLKEQK